MLRAIKDFSRGMHQLKWEKARCDLRIQELRETVRDLQLLHVTRDMQAAYQKGGQEARAADKLQSANEQASLENLAKQRDRLHKKALGEKARALRAMSQQIQEQAGQNTDVARHLVHLQKVRPQEDSSAPLPDPHAARPVARPAQHSTAPHATRRCWRSSSACAPAWPTPTRRPARRCAPW